MGDTLNLLSESDSKQLTTLLASAGRIVVTAHKSPDGDAIGSSLAWTMFLRQSHENVALVIPDNDPDFLHWLPEHNTIIFYAKHKDTADELLSKADLIFCLDYNELSRVEDMQEAMEKSKAPKVLIDHHVKPMDGCALTISHPTLSSTSEMVFRIINQLAGTEAITHNMAVCIYCGMMTDTGGFTFNSTRPEIFLIISELLKKNIDKDVIYNRVFHNYSSWALKFRAHVILNKLKIIEPLHASYYAVTRKEMKDFHFIKGDLEGVVNVPLTMKGHKLSISLREDRDKENLIWVSLRSSCGFHCREMAVRFFNGGGHDDASGGRLNCSIKEAAKITEKAIEAFKEQLQ